VEEGATVVVEEAVGVAVPSSCGDVQPRPAHLADYMVSIIAPST